GVAPGLGAPLLLLATLTWWPEALPPTGFEWLAAAIVVQMTLGALALWGGLVGQGRCTPPPRQRRTSTTITERSPVDAGCRDACRCRARVAEAGDAKRTCRSYAASSFPTSPGSPVGRVIPSSGAARRLGSV